MCDPRVRLIQELISFLALPNDIKINGAHTSRTLENYSPVAETRLYLELVPSN